MHRPPDRCHHQAVDGLNQYSVERTVFHFIKCFPLTKKWAWGRCMGGGLGRAQIYTLLPACAWLASEDSPLWNKKVRKVFKFIKNRNQLEDTWLGLCLYLQLSQASPTPSWSESLWSGLGRLGQLSFSTIPSGTQPKQKLVKRVDLA